MHMCDMAHAYVGYDSFLGLDRGRDSFVCAICLMHMCDMAHAYVGHDSFLGLDRGRDSFVCVT